MLYFFSEKMAKPLAKRLRAQVELAASEQSIVWYQRKEAHYLVALVRMWYHDRIYVFSFPRWPGVPSQERLFVLRLTFCRDDDGILGNECVSFTVFILLIGPNRWCLYTFMNLLLMLYHKYVLQIDDVINKAFGWHIILNDKRGDRQSSWINDVTQLSGTLWTPIFGYGMHHTRCAIAPPSSSGVKGSGAATEMAKKLGEVTVKAAG